MWSSENLSIFEKYWRNAIAVRSTQAKASIAKNQHCFTAKHKVCTHLHQQEYLPKNFTPLYNKVKFFSLLVSETMLNFKFS